MYLRNVGRDFWPKVPEAISKETPKKIPKETLPKISEWIVGDILKQSLKNLIAGRIPWRTSWEIKVFLEEIVAIFQE